MFPQQPSRMDRNQNPELVWAMNQLYHMDHFALVKLLSEVYTQIGGKTYSPVTYSVQHRDYAYKLFDCNSGDILFEVSVLKCAYLSNSGGTTYDPPTALLRRLKVEAVL